MIALLYLAVLTPPTFNLTVLLSYFHKDPSLDDSCKLAFTTNTMRLALDTHK